MLNRTERQNLGIQKWKESKCRGSCLYPTGFGKTRTAFMAITRFLKRNPKSQILVVVPTDYLKDQWFEQVLDQKLFDNVTVRVINTVIKSDWDIDLLVLDELHTYAADSFYTVFKKVKYKLILGLTGTLDRLDGKETLLKQKCPVVDEVSMEDAIENGWLSPYKEYKVMLDVDLTEYNTHNQDFIKYFSVFDFDFNLAMECVSGKKVANRVVKEAYLVRYEYAKSRCSLPYTHPNYAATVKSLNKEITASAYAWNRALQAKNAFIKEHPKKIEIAQKILNARQGCKAITFSATIKAAEKIGIGYTLHSGNTKKKRKLTKDEFDKLENGVLNTSKALDCGADIPGLNLGIILCNSSSSIQKKQRLGRIIRFAKDKKAELFTLVLKGTSEEQWFNKSAKEMDYTTITEEQLELVLNGNEITTRKREVVDLDFTL